MVHITKITKPTKGGLEVPELKEEDMHQIK